MPKWSGYHVKTDGRAYFRLRVPKDLHARFGEHWPTVNLGMKAGREAERLALMHYIAVQGLFDDTRKEIAEAALRPRPVPLSERTEADMRAFAVQIAQDLNRTQYVALRAGAPRSEVASLHDALTNVSGAVLSAQGAEGISPVAEAFLTAAGIAYEREHPSFQAFVWEFAAAIDDHYIGPSERRLSGRHVPPPPLPESPKVAPVLTIGGLVADYITKYPENDYKRKVSLCLTLFRERVGASLQVQALKGAHIRDFLLLVCKLPRDWGKRYKEKGESVADLLADEDGERIAKSTYEDNYRGTLGKFLADMEAAYGDQGFPLLTPTEN